MKKLLSILLALIVLCLPLTALAQEEATPDVPLPCDIERSGDDLRLTWDIPQNADGVELWRFSFADTSKVERVYAGSDEQLILEGIPELETCYTLRSYKNTESGTLYSAFSSLSRFKRTQISNFSLSAQKLTLNIGASRTLAASYDVDWSDIYYLPDVRFFSSDPDVASVDEQSGVVTANSAGTCTVTCTVTGGYSQSCTVSVNKTVKAANAFEFLSGEAASLPDMLVGGDNRLNGVVRADADITKIVVTIYDEASRQELKYTHKMERDIREYDLAELSQSIRFSSLKAGKKTLAVAAYIRQGGKTVYKKQFNVNKKAPTGKAAGRSIAAFASTRIGDPYSASKRGTGRYLDTSLLVNWCVRQALGSSAPTTAAEQYRSCVERQKTLKYSQLRAGDLIFYGSGSRKSYKGIWQVAVYIGGGKAVLAAAGGVEVVSAAKGSRIYYGRPY